MEKKKAMLSTGVALLLLVGIGLTYAWFSLRINIKSNEDISIKIGTLKLKYTDGSSISAENMEPGWTESKVVTIENTGTKDVNYKLTWKKLINEIINDELLLSINCESSNGSCTDMNFTGLPVVTSPDDITDAISIKSGEIHTINLTFEFKETGVSQNYNKRKNFLGIIDVQEAIISDNPTEYTMHTKIFDSNNNPISKAKVVIDSTITGTTDTNGYVSLEKILPGTHELVIKDSSNNVLDTKTIKVSQRNTSNVIDNEKIYVNKDIKTFSATITLDSTNKINTITNLIVPPSGCFNVYYGKISSYKSYNYCPTELIIPGTISGQTITGLSDWAFEGKLIRKVVIPNTIKSIGKLAFGNNKLTDITIPDSVTTIGDSAFENNLLTNATISKNITSMGTAAFNNNQLSDSQAFIYQRNSDGSENKTIIVSYGGKNKNISIPDGVVTLGDYSFSETGINSVTIPNTVTAIGTYAFEDNYLSSIVIPNTVTSIGNNAFAYNYLTSVTIPNSVTSLGRYSFSSNKLKSITLSNKLSTIEYSAFLHNNLTSVTIPSGVTSIGNYAFAYNNLTSVTIPSSVRTINDDAFISNNLTNLTIPNSVTSIGSYAFADNELTSVTIPTSVTSIGTAAFNYNLLPDDKAFIYERNSDGSENKNKIVSYGGKNKVVTIPSGVKIIGKASFDNIGITSITLPDSLTTIENYALEYNNLTELVIPNNVTTIGTSAFYNNKLTSVTLPDSITSIEWRAFDSNKLTSVTIPKGMTKIESSSFSNNNLTSVTIPKGITTIKSSAFSDNNLTSVTIPSTITSIGYYAFEGNNLTSVIIPSSVTEISTDAFNDNSFTSVTIKGKTSSSEFTSYNPNWGWSSSVTCVKNNTSNVTNGCITWEN